MKTLLARMKSVLDARTLESREDWDSLLSHIERNRHAPVIFFAGRRTRAFRWSRMRCEWGRWQVEVTQQVVDARWVWENP